jgi:DNA-binding FadR family transcriptional regulator
MSEISPLVKRSLVDQALDQLRLRINQGVWVVGQRLPTEPELSTELGISRNTVREAMRVLAFSGLIEIRRTDEDLLALREALGVSGSHYHGDLDTYIACDLVFHRRLVDAAHNPTLSELYRYFSSVVGAQLRQTLNIVPRRQEVFDLHIALLYAVEQRDPERAKALSRQLINEP